MFARMTISQSPDFPFAWGVPYPTRTLIVENVTDKLLKVNTPLASPFAGADIDLPAYSALVAIPDTALPDGFAQAVGNVFIQVNGIDVLTSVTPGTINSLTEWLDATYLPQGVDYDPVFV